MQAHLSRPGARLSFADAADELGRLKGVRVAAATARRRTEADGAVYAALQEAEAARVLAEAPPPPAGPPVQQVSVDGAMVGLADGSWREVRTLAVGTVAPGREAGAIRCADLSYFSRLADAATFTALAAGEVHRRGVESAGVVAGVVDGAGWCQAFLDAHRPDAVRILDVPHAAQRLSDVAGAVWGHQAAGRAWAAAQVRDEVLGYLEPRIAQTRYAAFRARGLPLGSGAVESANKIVVEARLKGAGRRWAERQVTPMVALRGALCSDRWEEAWAAIANARRGPRHRSWPPTAPAASAASVAAPARRVRQPGIPAPRRAGPKTIVNGRPTARHPWKRSPAASPPAHAKR